MSIRELPPALAEKARAELNENPTRLVNDLRTVKEWIAKQPHLNARTDDQWLVSFLRGCKYSLERTKEKIDIYYSLRTTAPELCRIKHTDPLFDEIVGLGAVLILPKAAGPDTPRVSLVRLGRYDPSKYNILDIIGVSNTIMKILMMEDDHATVAGVLNVVDLEGMTMSHFLQMTPVAIKKMITMGQDAAPFRLKGTHYLNMSAGFEAVFSILKSMLNEKNKKRFVVHNKNIDGMYKFIPKEVLPEEYGGDGGSTEKIVEYWRSKVKQYSSWLEDDEQYGTDESKRPGKPKTSANMFGIDGSFRTLDFD